MGVRSGVIFGALGVGLAALATAFIPLAVHRAHASTPPAFNGTTSVYAVTVSGGSPHRVLTLHGQYGFATGTADGRAVLIEKPGLYRTALWRIPLSGGTGRRLGWIPIFQYPLWSPDRTRVVLSDDHGVTAVYRADGTRLRTLTRVLGDGGVNCSAWAGSFLSCVSMTRPASGYHLELEVLRTDGSLAWHRPLTFPQATAAVAPDGQRVVVTRVHSVELVTPILRVRLPIADLTPWQAPQWTPDGRMLLYADARGRLVVRDMTTGRSRVLADRGADFGLSTDGRTAYVTRVSRAVSIPK